MSIDPLALCLNVGRAHACLNLKLQEELGAFHGLNYEDFTLLHRLLGAEGGRMPAADLARSLGLPVSALIRKMVLLEKSGLAERTAGANGDGRHAAIRPGGRKLMQAAVTTAEAICADTVKSLAPESLSQINAALLALCHDGTPYDRAVQRVDY
ncbi:DNA-binding MarR family transcriptional regulator [Variovorax beijingensis]|uniref:DNA-binding MarR family transcriptional regulator n=1 Tax=Variovorax beijingensis TaxID=2496117 RepID=A0A561B9D5_9BURK|nr:MULTISPECIES: MarR family transcriptional regulator [Variovorax]MDR6456683.1 DNA-binding MarR family transcriptional regulator [Variovorax paradoxus]TWD75554.1 DNA-binding MarR family transcriptional regulator [Variovorax beijingensis]